MEVDTRAHFALDERSFALSVCYVAAAGAPGAATAGGAKPAGSARRGKEPKEAAPAAAPEPPLSARELAGSTNFAPDVTAKYGTHYVTTAINYANGTPHVGHAYEALFTDVLARYHRLAGRRTFFLTGADEHGQKIANTAAREGICLLYTSPSPRDS